ncbi:proton-conducting transporter membrane subunit [Paenibacillus thailandensis]|uniref:Proton-conducting transporter membrane subunit n=1 Tax=Paenibacillus thailandensis TaxID=393250 RepID=A0ABW5R3N7_9BACL
MDLFARFAWVIPVFPLLAFLVQLALGRGFRKGGMWVGCVGSLLSFVMSLLVGIGRLQPNAEDYSGSFDWIRLGEYSLQVRYEVTNMTAALLAAAALLGFAAYLSASFGKGEDDRTTVLFSYLSLFQFALLGLLLSGDLLTLFLFWEMAGAGAFLLIGYYYGDNTAVGAAKRMFMTTRLGSAALLLAIVTLFWRLPDHLLDFASMHNALQAGTESIGRGTAEWIALLVLAAGAAQGALIPFYRWSIEAAEERSFAAFLPVAALPAAAVFLVSRLYDLFGAAESAMQAAAVLGGATALAAAAFALAQREPLKAVAHLSVSQTGLAFMAFGFGSVTGAIFMAGTNILTIAWMRAAVLRSGTGRTQAWLTAAAALALAGFPPFVGYWSSSAALKAAFAYSPAWYAVAVAAMLLKAAAAVRAGYGARQAALRGNGSGKMSVPFSAIVVPAVLCTAAGLVETPWNGWLSVWLTGAEPAAGGNAAAAAGVWLSILAGILLGSLAHRRSSAGPAGEAPKPLMVRLLQQEMYIPKLCRKFPQASLRALGKAVQAFDDFLVGRRQP